ncbi:hypothetical protein Q9L58_010363, partial [Maublancomyces gigas]
MSSSMMTALSPSQHRLEQALEAFHRILTSEEFSALSTGGSPPNAQSILNLTTEVNGKGKKRRLRRWAACFAPFLESFQRYSVAVETIVSSNPQIAALVWGSVKIVILVSLNFSGFFEKLAEMFQSIGYVSPILAEFQELFSESSGLRESLSGFYAVVVEFCTESLQFLKKASMRQFIELLWTSPFDFHGFEVQLRDQQQIILLQQTLASEKAAHQTRLQISVYQQRGEQHRAEQVVQRAGQEQRTLQKSTNETKRLRQALLEKLSDYNYNSGFLEACRKRHSGTGQWLFDCSEFQEWDQADVSSGLWIHGIPGSGKTILAAGVVEHLCEIPRAATAKTSISYFFCDFNDRISREPQTILRSLTRQILNAFDETPEIGETLKSMFNSHNEPRIKELSALLASVSQLPTTAYLILDGLDECQDSDRRQLLKSFTDLIRGGKGLIKIIIASRWMNLLKSLDSFSQISLESANNSADIGHFVRGIIDEKIEDETIAITQPSMAEEIKQTLIRKSDGMFLWVKFQIDEIAREHNDEGIRRVLQSLPKGLNETYARILQRIKRDRKPDVARTVFQWLAVTRRPLLLDELAECVALGLARLEPGALLSDHIARHLPTNTLRILQDCENLVTHRKEDNIVRFAHSTVLEFLLTPPPESSLPGAYTSEFLFDRSEVELYVGETCLAYLASPEFETQISIIPNKTGRDVSANDMPISDWVPSM